jgi:hypothetical protein
MIGLPPICTLCKHLDRKNENAYTCAAFPSGIPEIIYMNQTDHRQPISGDNGITFEKRPDVTDAKLSALLSMIGFTQEQP